MMEKTFSKLLGNRVYLEIPKKDKSKLVVDENTKTALQKELMKKMSKLKVFAVREGVTDASIKEGVYVLVNPEALARRAVVVPLSDETEVRMVYFYDIIHIW